MFRNALQILNDRFFCGRQRKQAERHDLLCLNFNHLLRSPPSFQSDACTCCEATVDPQET